ncbi:MAG: hypothetical protein LBQ40_04505 [Clostridiales bacterium]|jgi:hypothetical protein|nr:hypothetical protein [Clostridiales bacterium]
MPNSIQLAQNFTDLLDEVYKNASVTADLISDASIVKAGVNANEIAYPQIDMSGLGDYDRNSGYTDGAVNLEYKTTQFNYDRGTKLSVDVMDDEETAGIAFGRLGAELQRTKVAPEADAFTFATIAGTDGVATVEEDIADGEEFLTALLTAKNVLDEAEVPEDERYLYATPTLMNGILALDTYKSKEVLNSFSVKKSVPQSRFYTKIDLLDGKSTGETVGHYRKSEDGLDINFMIIHKPAIIKFDKHVASDVINPKDNAASDAYILKYRKYGIVDVYQNKAAGIYVSHKAAPVSE